MTKPIHSVLGLTRVRNEGLIFEETLDHFAQWCDRGIVVYDDASTDDTREIAEKHPAVVEVVKQYRWCENRLREEWRHRQMLVDRGRAHTPDWFLYFDADERIEWNFQLPSKGRYDSVSMKLWDAYITEEDRDEVGTGRKWFGPEWREIIFLFRNQPKMRFHLPDQRIVDGFEKPLHAGAVRHYGKAVSVREWEATCRYYANYFPEPYRSKWLSRMGHAVHTESDFGRPLVKWAEAKKCAKDDELCIGRLPDYARRRW